MCRGLSKNQIKIIEDAVIDFITTIYSKEKEEIVKRKRKYLNEN